MCLRERVVLVVCRVGDLNGEAMPGRQSAAAAAAAAAAEASAAAVGGRPSAIASISFVSLRCRLIHALLDAALHLLGQTLCCRPHRGSSGRSRR